MSLRLREKHAAMGKKDGFLELYKRSKSASGRGSELLKTEWMT